MGIQELLTKERQDLLIIAKGLVERSDKAQAAWSWDGNIFLLMNIGRAKTRRFLVRSAHDIQNVAKSCGCNVFPA
jgi:hypothetical protein